MCQLLRRLWFWSLLWVTACGGQTIDSVGAGGTGGTGGTTPAGGAGGMAQSGGAAGVPIPDAGTGSGGGASCDWSTPPNVAPGACGQWWGGTLVGARGPTSCPCPSDPAMLAYGQTMHWPCVRISGPVAATSTVAGLLSCNYLFDESACPAGKIHDWWIDVPYFGGGSSKLSLPTTSFSEAKAKCTAPKGPPASPGGVGQHAELLIGRWAVCSTKPDSVISADGLVFHPDGSFQKLVVSPSGKLVTSEECNAYGLWGFWPDENQLNLFMDIGTAFSHVEFRSGSPRFADMTDGVIVEID